MSDLHHQHGTTVVEEREGAGTALMVILAVAVIAFLIWLFAFSGAFGGDDVDVNIPDNRTTEQTNNDTTQPGGTTDDGSGGDTGTDTNTDTDTDTTTP